MLRWETDGLTIRVWWTTETILSPAQTGHLKKFLVEQTNHKKPTEILRIIGQYEPCAAVEVLKDGDGAIYYPDWK